MLDFNPPLTRPSDPPDVAFCRAMAEHGLDPGGLIADDCLIRFDIERGDKAGWYVFYSDGNCPAGSFGNWRSGLKKTWSYKAECEMSPGEIDIFRRHVSDMKKKREEEEARRHAEAKAVAEKYWPTFAPAPDDHPYLTSKGVRSYGLRVASDGRLVVPIFDLFNDLHSFQYVGDKKRFLPGGAISGNFFTIPGSDKVFICEGYATGATIHEATGGTVVVAFNAGNLKAVALNVKSKFPTNQIIICADNDTETETADGRKNPGVISATEAAKAINAKLIVPSFKNPSGKKTSDFNDLAKFEGVEAVRLQINGAPKRINLDTWKVSEYKGAAPERRWLVRHTFPLASVGILAAMGDAGKGMLSLDLALKVAADPSNGELDFGYGAGEAFGNMVMESGAVVIFSAEDDRDEIHRRLEQIDKDGVRFGEKCRDRLVIVPLPNAGGPIPLVVPGKSGPEASPIFFEIKEQLSKIENLKLAIFDPLASFIGADINADPAVGAFTTGLLSSMATETGAFILIAHHMGKGGGGRVTTPEQARNLIRGTSAIVDGVRAAYVLWPMLNREAKQKCNMLGVSFERNRVFSGALVKANGPGDREVKTFVRGESGLLIVEDKRLDAVKLSNDDLKAMLSMDIAKAAEYGRPFTATSPSSGLFGRNEELSKQTRALSKEALRSLVKQLLDEGEVVKCIAGGSKTPQWLDIPGGPFATGNGVFEHGARKEEEGGTC